MSKNISAEMEIKEIDTWRISQSWRMMAIRWPVGRLKKMAWIE
jgi:hypothetical protein